MPSVYYISIRNYMKGFHLFEDQIWIKWQLIGYYGNYISFWSLICPLGTPKSNTFNPFVEVSWRLESVDCVFPFGPDRFNQDILDNEKIVGYRRLKNSLGFFSHVMFACVCEILEDKEDITRTVSSTTLKIKK